MLRTSRNSVLYAVLATVFMLVSSIPAAYALARIRFRGRTSCSLRHHRDAAAAAGDRACRCTSCGRSSASPAALWPLILPNLLGDAFSIFLLRQFFLTIPQEYTDAARVDGVRRVADAAARHRADGPAGHRGDGDLPVLRRLERLLRAAALHLREPSRLAGLLRARASFRGRRRVRVEPHDGATMLVMVPVVLLFFLAQRVVRPRASP